MTGILALRAATLAAQYPLAPSPVLDLHTLAPELRLSGYLSVRATQRRDTLTFNVNRARVTALAKPAPYAALRIQVDFTATGRSSGDTVPAIVLTDAYIQLEPPATSRAAALHPALIVGQFRSPFALEFLTPFSVLQTVNRSLVVDRVSTRREIGVLAQLLATRHLRVQGAAVNGDGPNRLTNNDGRAMLFGRVTVFPVALLSVAGKYMAEGSSHAWGTDGRWIGHGAIVEGEFIARRGLFAPTTSIDSRGGYVLASYKVRPWLQPAVKWEELHDSRTAGGTTTTSYARYTTVGINVLSRGERVRLLVDGIFKQEQPVSTGNELVAQLVAIF
ncbi:MAG: hypothetical protein ACM358_07460 [Gemmatimonadota bacterium]